jgi:hypothetical protein
VPRHFKRNVAPVETTPRSPTAATRQCSLQVPQATPVTDALRDVHTASLSLCQCPYGVPVMVHTADARGSTCLIVDCQRTSAELSVTQQRFASSRGARMSRFYWKPTWMKLLPLVSSCTMPWRLVNRTLRARFAASRLMAARSANACTVRGACVNVPYVPLLCGRSCYQARCTERHAQHRARDCKQ